MSAQRRTTAKSNATAGTATAATVPAPAPTRPAKPAPAPKAAVPKPANERPPKQAVVEKKPSAIALRTESARKLARETWAEMKKINWPDQQTTRSLTILVIGISVVLGLLLGGVDYIFLKLLDLF